jgi:hypothetical protein
MDKDMIRQMILNFQRQTVQIGVFRVSFRLIYIVRCESDSLTKRLVIQHQQRPVEELNLAIPKDVKEVSLRESRIPKQQQVMLRKSYTLTEPVSLPARMGPEINKLQIRSGVERRAIDRTVADDIQTDTFPV